MSETASEAVATEPTIRIVSRAHDGFRRGGVAHPADAIYPADSFTREQLALIEAEPLLTVIKSDGADKVIAAKAKAKK